MINFQEWDSTLNANVAGAQSNAEDFTKQFMSDMFGGGGGGGGQSNGGPPPGKQISNLI